MTDHIIGSAPYQYRMRRDWAQLPDGMQFRTTHAVCETSDGRIVIHHTGPQCIYVFSPDGELLSSWGADFHAGAHGMDLVQEDGEDVLFLAASNAGIVAKMTLTGEELMRMGTPLRSDIYDSDHRYTPTESAVARNGDIYVADGYGEHWIHHYAKDGRYISSFGGHGSEIGQLNNPHGLTIDNRTGEERLLVADRGNHRLHYFTLDGQPLNAVYPDVRLPCTAVQVDDLLYVPDLHSRISILDATDKVLVHLGDWPDRWKDARWPDIPSEEWAPDRFSSPHDLHVDGAGNIYVVEWLNNGTGCVAKLEHRPS